MVAQKTFVTNAAETTLSSSLASGATTINVTSSSAFPSVPFYAVIDPDVNASREVILVDSAKTATTFTLTAASKRGQDGTTDTSHSSGAKVVCVPVAALWTDINDRVDAVAAADYQPGGTDVAVVDGGTGASTASAARANLGLIIGTNVYGPGSIDVAVADGGTGASDAVTARTNLSIVGTVGGDTITASGAAVKPLVLKGATSQTANLLELQNSAGTTLASFSNIGALILPQQTHVVGAGTAESGALLNVTTSNSGAKPLVVRGAASQVANLQEWQGSAGTALLYVTANGALQGADGLPIAGPSQQAAPAAGSGSALPATPDGYLRVVINGTTRSIPYYPAI